MSRSGTSTPGAGPSSQPLLDPYRSLASAIQRPLAPFLPVGSTPTLPDVLGLDERTYRERVEGKTLLLDDTVIPKTPSALLKGKKLHRGDEAAYSTARKEAEGTKQKRKRLELVGMRKARKRGGMANRGDYVDYASLLPLHHLHVLYLVNLMSLPPLPSPLPDPLPALPPGISHDGLASKLLKADFTGISLEILASRNPSLNGISGIVIEETGATFRLVGEDGKIKVVPKEGTQFGLSFPAYSPLKSAGDDPIDVEGHLRTSPRIEMNMLGTNFGYRSGDRAGRRFRLAQGDAGNGWGEDWVRAEWDDLFASIPSSGGSRAKSEHSSRRTNGGEREKGQGGAGMRKKGKSRRKDPFAGGCREVMF